MSQWADSLGMTLDRFVDDDLAERVLERARKELLRRGIERTTPARVVNFSPAGDDLDNGVLPVTAGAPAGAGVVG